MSTQRQLKELPFRDAFRLVLMTLVLLVATIAVGKLTLLDAVKSLDEPVFDLLARSFQQVPGVVKISTRLTRLGAIPVNYGMALALAGFVGLQRRRWDIAALVFGSLFGSHVFQEIVKLGVGGFEPTGSYIQGASGPYYSGGVMRIMVIVGMAVTLTQTAAKHSDSFVYRMAGWAGVFVAITRIALGRHWPLDLLAAFPVGFAFVWLFREALKLIDNTFEPEVAVR